jgi:hypothetical protein
MNDIPVLDFHTPVVALIQLVLFVGLPWLVGQITDKLTASRVKVILLGSLTLLGVILTRLLDIAIADAWATVDWIALINVAVNWAVGWALAQSLGYNAILKPTGAIAAAQKSNVIQLFGPSTSAKHAA